MACAPIVTGDEFLTRTLAHIDCQAQVIGSYGYQALGQPGSLASSVVAGLLTLFIALFAIRLLFGPQPVGRDAVYGVLTIGIVLTLAFSWPAFRTVIYDVTLKGPAEVVSVIQPSSVTGADASLPQRLQAADGSIARLTVLGTGRNAGALIDGAAPDGTFASTALQDEEALGSARLLYLASVIGTLGLLRIGAGLLLAVTPLVAGLYFFAHSRGIVAGWLKALVFTIGGSIGATLVLAVQLAILEPWLGDAIRVRELGYATPSAPTELFAIMLAFTIVQLAMLWLVSRVVFYRGWLSLPNIPSVQTQTASASPSAPAPRERGYAEIERSERISNSIETAIRREQSVISSRMERTPALANAGGETARAVTSSPQRLGSTYRRPMTRGSRASRRRDQSQ